MTYVGTPYYVAPEVFRGERYGMSADIFSLGIVLNRLIRCSILERVLIFKPQMQETQVAFVQSYAMYS